MLWIERLDGNWLSSSSGPARSELCISTVLTSDCISGGFPRAKTETNLRLGPFGQCEDQYGWVLEVEGVVFGG